MKYRTEYMQELRNELVDKFTALLDLQKNESRLHMDRY